ncbi:MAG: hypothetical protein AB7G21_09975 [Dehalococcoidia bacterium]
MPRASRPRYELVEVLGGFELWDRQAFRDRPAYSFPRRASAVVDPYELDWWERRGAVCHHPREWVQRGRCLVPDPETRELVPVGFKGIGWLKWDECRLCGARLNSRAVREDGAVTLRGKPAAVKWPRITSDHT